MADFHTQNDGLLTKTIDFDGSFNSISVDSDQSTSDTLGSLSISIQIHESCIQIDEFRI